MDKEMEPYQAFAQTYDMFMDDIPYEAWHTYLLQLLRKHGVTEGIIAELGCGTGTMTRLLAEDGYDMIGIDRSVEMLQQARDKCPDSVLLLHQDMTELELYGTVAAMVCICDGMNYLLEPKELVQVFRQVAFYLDQEGVFIFDMKTPHFYEMQLGTRSMVDNREEGTLLWENEYDIHTGRNEYLLTIYQIEDEEKALYRRVEEYQCQQSYTTAVVKESLEQAGLVLREMWEAFTETAPNEESDRIYYVVAKS